MMKSIRLMAACVAIACIAWAQPGYGQDVTTGSLTGTIRDQQGGVLPGVTVSATHVPTGTVYEGVTAADGSFALLNVRVGGPYAVTAALPGFRQQRRDGIAVNLGQSTSVDLTLQVEGVTETVLVTAEASAVFTGSNAGTSGNVEQALIENLPTIQRSLQDFARVNPFFSPAITNDSAQGALSVGGRSGRYNNLQIDGAVNNDLFGLADSALPGGQANTEPVSLDAIQELQLVVSPYDVRQGNFSGGGINAITRSGTNEFHGSGYYYTRNQDWVGDGISGVPIATFSDNQGGFSIGGPMRRNRAFFFGNFESQRRDTPSGFSVDGSSGIAFGNVAEANRILAVLQSRAGYNPGGLEEFIRESPNDKFLIKTDFNLGTGHQLTVRHNYVNGSNHVGFQNNTDYKFPDNFYQIENTTNSTVGQLNSTFGMMVNQARVSVQRIRDRRAGPTRFPFMNIEIAGFDEFQVGTERFSTANELDQDIVEVHNDLTWIRGSHQFTIGTHNEFFKFRNLFIRDKFGAYDFLTLELFEQGLAQRFEYSYSATSDPLQPARFSVLQFGGYAGDQWRVSNDLTLTYGLRIDRPVFPDSPSANPAVEAAFGRRTDTVPASMTWSPRVGFNYDLGGETSQQVRGGVGLFGGRTPYVWLSNQYTNTGQEFVRLDTGFSSGNRIPVVWDPDAQPTTVGGAATSEINLVDPDYTYPQTIRGNFGYDRGLGWQGMVASAELLFSKSTQDIDYRNLNLRQTGTRPDGRPVWARINTAFLDVVELTNTNKGDAWTLALSLNRPFRNRWTANGSYSYGRSRTVSDGGSSQARSNWINVANPGDASAAPLAISNFDPGHRIVLSGAVNVPTGGGTSALLSLFYNGQSGRPYAYRFTNDVNTDGSSTNDLLYIPSGPNDAIVTGGTFDQLMTFLNSEDCSDLPSGGIQERNTCRSPWTNRLDFKAAFEVPVQRVEATIEFNVLNLINLLSSEHGLSQYVLFNTLGVASGTVDAATGKYRYSLAAITQPGRDRYSRDDLRSRWQAQLGLRLRF